MREAEERVGYWRPSSGYLSTFTIGCCGFFQIFEPCEPREVGVRAISPAVAEWRLTTIRKSRTVSAQAGIAGARASKA